MREHIHIATARYKKFLIQLGEHPRPHRSSRRNGDRRGCFVHQNLTAWAAAAGGGLILVFGAPQIVSWIRGIAGV